MKALTNESSFLLLKKKLISNEMLLIDENGSYTQKEAFEVYCGIINELSELIKEDTACLIRGYACKELPLIALAVVALGGIIAFTDKEISFNDFINIHRQIATFDVLINYDNRWSASKNGDIRYLSFKKQDLVAQPRLVSLKDKPSFYFFTSGSTGDTKIAAISEYSFINHVNRMADFYDDRGITYFCVPACHIFGVAGYINHILAGKCIYISNTRNPDKALLTIEKLSCTFVANVPTFYYMLIDAQNKNPRNISSLKYGVIAGGGYSKEQFCNIENKLGISLCSSYGMTEGCTTISNSPVNVPIEERSSGVGRPFDGVDVVLKDDNGLKNALTGEVCFKGYNLMLGYLTSNGLDLPLDDEGYFHTGDLGTYDKNNILHIVGRKKNIIIRGGENLSPAFIASRIMNVNGVLDACVVGISNQKYGEIVGAWIRKDDSLSNEKCLEEMKLCLRKSEIPEVIIFDENIPLLNNGKHDLTFIKKALLDKVNSKGD